MLKTRLVLKLTPVQIAQLQPLFQEAIEKETMICGSIDIDNYDSIKLNVVDRETALEIEKLADTKGENDAGQTNSPNIRLAAEAEIKP